MATLYRASGEVFSLVPDNGKSFTLEELYRILNCTYVETIRTLDNGFLIFDEDGKQKGLRPNAPATGFGIMAGIAQGDYIAGDAILASPWEMD